MKRILMAGMALFALANPAAAVDELATNFATPPPAARPWVYWFWLNGNITRQGLTADLEAMQRAGIGGVLIMEVDQGAPVGPVAFMGEQWRELFKFMVAEASRLGIEVNMNNDAGWNGSGGPWVPLDKAMQVVVTSEVRVAAGKPFAGNLPQPRANDGFYQDISVLAFPTPKDPNNPAHRIQNLPAKSMAWGGMPAGHDHGPLGPALRTIEHMVGRFHGMAPICGPLSVSVAPGPLCGGCAEPPVRRADAALQPAGIDRI